MNIRERLDSIPKGVMLIFVFFGLGAVFFLDYMTGSEISISILYLIPISMSLWYIGKWEAIFFSILSAISWYFGEIGRHYSSDTIIYWNSFVRLGFFFIVVILLDYIKKFNSSLGELIRLRTNELEKEIAVRKGVEEEVKEKNEQLSHLAMNIQKVKEEENLKVAREIHDELGQVLTALKMEISLLGAKMPSDEKTIKKLESVNNLIDEIINSVRKISTSLRPRLLDELGLFPAMEMQIRELQTRTGIRCILKLPDIELVEDKDTSLAIFRIFQEAITNILRHASATNVLIKCYMENERFIMEIKDNGIGIKDERTSGNGSLGILGMKERAHLLNGNIEIKSIPKGGTLIRADIPLNYN